MPQFDLAGNPLPEATGGGQSVRYDLAGNPLPADPPASQSSVPPPVSVFPNPTMPFPGLPNGGMPLPGAPPAFGGTAPGQSEGPKIGVYVGLAVAAFVLLALIFVLRAGKPVLVAAPTAYTSYMAVDKSFTCDDPAGWTRTVSGVDGGNAAGVVFKNGAARVSIGSDLVGSLVGDTFTPPTAVPAGSDDSGLPPPPKQTPPVEKLHMMEVKSFVEKYIDYDELPMQPLATPVGAARISEWTAAGGAMAGKLHGYRVTILGAERRFIVICHCPDRNWSVLQPAFMHMIQSITLSNG